MSQHYSDLRLFMATYGVQQIDVEFSGAGDSGDINDVTLIMKDPSLEIDQHSIHVQSLTMRDYTHAMIDAAVEGKVVTHDACIQNLHDFLLDVTNEIMSDCGRDGYENGDGGSGVITITQDVATLEFTSNLYDNVEIADQTFKLQLLETSSDPNDLVAISLFNDLKILMEANDLTKVNIITGMEYSHFDDHLGNVQSIIGEKNDGTKIRVELDAEVASILANYNFDWLVEHVSMKNEFTGAQIFAELSDFDDNPSIRLTVLASLETTEEAEPQSIDLIDEGPGLVKTLPKPDQLTRTGFNTVTWLDADNQVHIYASKDKNGSTWYIRDQEGKFHEAPPEKVEEFLAMPYLPSVEEFTLALCHKSFGSIQERLDFATEHYGHMADMTDFAGNSTMMSLLFNTRFQIAAEQMQLHPNMGHMNKVNVAGQNIWFSMGKWQPNWHGKDHPSKVIRTLLLNDLSPDVLDSNGKQVFGYMPPTTGSSLSDLAKTVSAEIAVEDIQHSQSRSSGPRM
ncbi:DUF6878 family protein [Methylobacillus sp. Pita2]|uniref:DUF6878 family protein n=1 Tax=Methylobacillus sp. Pita2 TaxID=3383245 RepID=UPI0038B61D7B